MSMFELPNYEYRSKRVSMCQPLIEGEWNTLMDVGGPGIIKHIWITFPLKDKFFGRKNILRIYWEDEVEPSVEAPLADFFGVPMGFTGQEFQINSYFISVVPQNGMNCYFPMPFHKRARVELLVNMQESGNGFYFQADYEACENGLPVQWRDMRFHAKYRMESPTESHGHRYLALDAEGEGYLVGTTFGIRRIEEQKDAWYHGGGDLVYIDGETNPYIIHGIGAEDYFGHSWGTDTSSMLYIGNPFYQTLTTDHQREQFNAVLYRFHVQDPIRFKRSISFMLGAMGDKISSVAYWYQKEPHREFFVIPEQGNILQEDTVPRLTRDIELPHAHRWHVFGPIKDEVPFTFDDVHPLEVNPDLSFTSQYHIPHQDCTMQTNWRKLSAHRGFVDFNIRMRPETRGIRFQTACYGLALGYLYLEKELVANVRIGFDDRVRLRINGEVLLEAEHVDGFANEWVPVKLQKGLNTFIVKLSNNHNTNFKAWVFNLAIVDDNGKPLENTNITDHVR